MVSKKEPEASIRVTLTTKPAVAAMKDLTKRFKRNATDINQSFELLGKGLRLVTGIVRSGVNAFKEFTKLSGEQDRVERSLIAAMRLRGEFTEKNFRELQKFNSEIQQNLGFGDELLLQGQSTLAALGIRKEAIQDATKATIGLTTVGLDFKAASILVGKALSGQLSVLTRYGIKATSVADAQEQLNTLFKLAEAQAGSVTTAFKVFDANFGDLKETIGASVTDSDSVLGSMGALNNAILSLVEFFKSPDGRRAVDTFFKTLAELAADTLDTINRIVQVQQDVSKAFKKTSQEQGAFASKTKEEFGDMVTFLKALGPLGAPLLAAKNIIDVALFTDGFADALDEVQRSGKVKTGFRAIAEKGANELRDSVKNGILEGIKDASDVRAFPDIFKLLEKKTEETGKAGPFKRTFEELGVSFGDALFGGIGIELRNAEDFIGRLKRSPELQAQVAAAQMEEIANEQQEILELAAASFADIENDRIEEMQIRQDLEIELLRFGISIRKELKVEELQFLLDANIREAAINNQRTAQIKSSNEAADRIFQVGGRQILLSSVQLIADLSEGLGRGRVQVGKALKAMAFQMADILGNTAIQMGLVGIAASSATALFGVPGAGAVAAGVLLAAGIAMKAAIGFARGATASRTPGGGSRGAGRFGFLPGGGGQARDLGLLADLEGGRDPSRFDSQASSVPRSSGAGGGQTLVFNVSFPGFVGSKRRLARELEDVARSGMALSPAGA